MRKKIYDWVTKATRPSPQDHAKELLISLMFNSSTEYQIETFEALKSMFQDVLKEKEIESAKECRLINCYLRKPTKKYDPNFDKPISEIEVDYELINKIG